jgi:hypothetical protein
MRHKISFRILAIVFFVLSLPPFLFSCKTATHALEPFQIDSKGVQVREVLHWKQEKVKDMERAIKDGASDKILREKADGSYFEIYDPVTKKWYQAKKKDDKYEMTEYGKSMWKSDTGQMSGSSGGGGGGH